MTVYVALLRGVNVGGHTFKMALARKLWCELGFKNPRTYLQSGNVVFETDGPREKQIARIERAILAETHWPVSILLRSALELEKVVTGNPFLSNRSVDHSKLHVTFLGEAVPKDAVKRLGAVDAGADRFHCGRREIYLHCPNGYARTKLANNHLERRLGVTATTRNWNTVTTLHEMVAG